MRFPIHLVRAQGTVLSDLTGVEPVQGYLACFGKARGLSRLATMAGLSSLWISGVNPAQLQEVAACSGLQTLVIHDLRVADMASLKNLTQLHTLLIWGNTKASHLETLAELNSLRVLGLEHFSRVRSLEPLGRLLQLQLLSLEGSMEKAMSVETLQPLARLTQLQELRLLHVKVGDRCLEPLCHLVQLEDLCLGNLYPSQEVARLVGRLPRTHCNLFRAHFPTNIPCSQCGAAKVMLVEERLTLLCPECDRDRVQAHQRNFEAAIR